MRIDVGEFNNLTVHANVEELAKIDALHRMWLPFGLTKRPYIIGLMIIVVSETSRCR